MKIAQAISAPIRITISILNWNGSDKTARCLQGVSDVVRHCGSALAFAVELLDNGSEAADWEALKAVVERTDCPGVNLRREPNNLGFAGGHNVIIASALKTGADYIWLLNNDATPEVNCMDDMLRVMTTDAGCGIVTPLIVSEHDPEIIDFAGGLHRWVDCTVLRTDSITEGAAMEAEHRQDCWVVGTAILLRTSAIRRLGPLESSYFAYFEDNEISARYARGGFVSRVAFKSKVMHFSLPNLKDRAPYFFYLMARNEMRFWVETSMNASRSRIRYQMLQRAFRLTYRLKQDGMSAKADACLLGSWDGLWKRGGPPVLNRYVPWVMRLAFKLSIARGVPS
jgi:GT2 family glycosyltransferase